MTGCRSTKIEKVYVLPPKPQRKEIQAPKDLQDYAQIINYYDHPGERIAAKEELDEKLSHYPERTWKKVWELLKGDNEISNFYHNNFHKMKEEYVK